ncbi:MAG: hypothetical protein PHO27_06050 [Sulfuricurvum sp.]|nr:hypothetical protein [Sulfuricurvum sp.]
MAKKKILTIGFDLSSEDTQFSEFDSDLSLLDWDIILFKPDIMDYIYRPESTFQGKPCLSDDKSFKLKAQTEHWRREIKSAVESGKLVIAYLSELIELSIATGEKNFSGTGRNQKTTRLVDNYNNFASIPSNMKPVKTKGQEIKLAANNTELISTYWQEFSSYSSYKVLLTEELPACLVTKHGEKTVGAILRSKHSSGALLLLPDIDFYSDEFFDENGGWTKKAEQFSAKLINTVVSIDKALRNLDELTPEPEWAKEQSYKLKEENSALVKLLQVESKLEKAQVEKEIILEQIKDLGRLRNLLFEKGKPLEYAILDALKIIGFDVSQFNDGKSEFDAVFQSKEGRLIGEAEGKDNKAVNIDKLRQLALNIHEDLERDDIESPAKAVLFGNSYRLIPVEERDEPFTTKCMSAASTSSTALVFTPDLFNVAQYLSNNKDARFATKCRKVLFTSIGRVQFPPIPQ